MEKTSHSAPPPTTAAADASPPFFSSSGGGPAVPTSSTGSTNSASTASSAMHNPIRLLNKASHKISKPGAKPHHLPRCQSSLITTSVASQDSEPQQVQPPPAQSPPQPPSNLAPPQPPVYNINKNDFRDVVQKLTGSTSHHNPRPPSVPSPPPPVKPTTTVALAPPNATSSRLHRIRPPPLAQLVQRPPPLVQPPVTAPGMTAGVSTLAGVGSFFGDPESGTGYAWARPWMSTPLSPLPPLPAVSAAAESPISAYMRRLQGGGSNALLPLSPGPMGAPLFPLPSSPLGMGCLPSPRSAFQTTLPQSPRVPLPSPKMKDH